MKIREMNPKQATDTLTDTARELWKPYDEANITVTFESVSLASLKSLISIINAERYESNRMLRYTYTVNDIALFSPIVIDEDETQSVVLPPIIERSQHGYMIIDGVHRLVASSNNHDSDVLAAVIHSDQPLPPYAGQAFDLHQVSPSSAQATQKPLYTGSKKINPLFRPGAKIAETSSLRIQESLS